MTEASKFAETNTYSRSCIHVITLAEEDVYTVIHRAPRFLQSLFLPLRVGLARCKEFLLVLRDSSPGPHAALPLCISLKSPTVRTQGLSVYYANRWNASVGQFKINGWLELNS
jgi:hypothetical protein